MAPSLTNGLGKVETSCGRTKAVVGLTVEHFALFMRKIEKRRAVGCDIFERRDINIHAGYFALSDRHFQTQVVSDLTPAESWALAHDHQQIVCRHIAMGRTSGQRAEQKNVLRVVYPAGEVANNLRRLFGIVLLFLGCFDLSVIADLT